MLQLPQKLNILLTAFSTKQINTLITEKFFKIYLKLPELYKSFYKAL